MVAWSDAGSLSCWSLRWWPAAAAGREPPEPSHPPPDRRRDGARRRFELGAWHELVAGPEGLVLVNGYPEDETDPGPLELWRQTAEGWEAIPASGDRPERAQLRRSRRRRAARAGWSCTAA